jgi:hypothetical protein
MIYTIKLTYCFKVPADSRDEAYRKAVEQMRKEPGAYITGVVEGEFLKQKSLLNRLVFGW